MEQKKINEERLKKLAPHGTLTKKDMEKHLSDEPQEKVLPKNQSPSPQPIPTKKIRTITKRRWIEMR
jgi:hypothetical protein